MKAKNNEAELVLNLFKEITDDETFLNQIKELLIEIQDSSYSDGYNQQLEDN